MDTFNGIVKDVYGHYIENVTRYMRSFEDGQEQSLPFSNVSFAIQPDYDPGTFEYQLHHHHSLQSHNPSISPFAGPSGLTHERVMSNYNPIAATWDLAYDLDLSPQIVPFVDVDCRDHTNTAYYLNSYALDFFKDGSEKLLIRENGLKSGDTHQLLMDLHLVLASVKTSLEAIVKSDETQANKADLSFFRPVFKSLSGVQEKFTDNFQRAYRYRNAL